MTSISTGAVARLNWRFMFYYFLCSFQRLSEDTFASWMSGLRFVSGFETDFVMVERSPITAHPLGSIKATMKDGRDSSSPATAA